MSITLSIYHQSVQAGCYWIKEIKCKHLEFNNALTQPQDMFLKNK